MTNQSPPIVRLAERLLVDVEEASTRFVRRHKYTFGDKLRSVRGANGAERRRWLPSWP
jgi:hypothetical protein